MYIVKIRKRTIEAIAKTILPILANTKTSFHTLRHLENERLVLRALFKYVSRMQCAFLQVKYWFAAIRFRASIDDSRSIGIRKVCS